MFVELANAISVMITNLYLHNNAPIFDWSAQAVRVFYILKCIIFLLKIYPAPELNSYLRVVFLKSLSINLTKRLKINNTV